jgi:hypothetical protein
LETGIVGASLLAIVVEPLDLKRFKRVGVNALHPTSYMNPLKSRPANICNVAALERSDNVAKSDHAFAMLKRGYPSRAVMALKM